MVGKEDQKVIIEKFKGIYNRDNLDGVPLDHAQDALNVILPSGDLVQTREGVVKVLSVGTNIRRFFLLEAIPPNYGDASTGDPSATDGSGLLWLDNSGNFYIGNDPTPIYSCSGAADFSAINAGNRTYVSPFNGAIGLMKGRLQVLNSLTGVIRDAAGLAPIQASGSSLAAANSSTAGVVPAGVHKIAVIYETDTGFWTPPGPKITKSVTIIADDPMTMTCSSHGMVTGESHQISGTSTSGDDVWHITKIDDNTFSVPCKCGATSGSGSVAGPFTPATVTADGTHKIDVSNIPTGPTGTSKRIILATRANEEEFFFVPDVPGSPSTISDNSATTVTIDFSDTDLVASADYLFDLLEVIPGGSSMTKYAGRIVIAGTYQPGISERVLLSNVNDPETFNFTSGAIQVQTERDGNSVFCTYVLRSTLYMSKFTGIFATQDNGQFPSTWAVSVVDSMIGSYSYGVSSFTASQQTPDTGDIILIANRAGLYVLDGVIRRPELTQKISKLWLRININTFFRVQVTHDPWRHLIYITAPLDTATEPNTLFVGDYTDGRDSENIRWTVWQFQKKASCISMMFFGSLTKPLGYYLHWGSLDSGAHYLYRLDPAATDDDGTTIQSYYIPGQIELDPGTVNFFKALKFRAGGVGALNLNIFGEDDYDDKTPPNFTLSLAATQELGRQINLVNEKMTIKFASGTTKGDYMMVARLDVWGLPVARMRPM